MNKSFCKALVLAMVAVLPVRSAWTAAVGADVPIEAVVPAAPFADEKPSVPSETVFTKTSYTCGSKAFVWSQGYTSAHLAHAGKNLFRFRVWGGPPEASWHPYEKYVDTVDVATKSVERRCDFRAKGGRDAAFFQRYRLTDDKKIAISFDFSDNILPKEKPFTFALEFERASLEGKTFTGWDKDGKMKKLVLGKGAEWPTRPWGVLNCVKLAFDVENPANAWTIEYHMPVNLNFDFSKQAAFVRHNNMAAAPFPYAFDLDLGRESYATEKECVIAGVNFTGNNAMDIPQYSPRNMLMNPSFEAGLRHWHTAANGRDYIRLYDKEAHTGRYSAIFPYYRAVTFGIPVEANKDYTVSFWAKSINGKKIRTELVAWQYGQVQPVRFNIAAEPEWKRFSFPARFVSRCCVIGGDSNLSVIYDDFQIEPGTNATEYAGNPIGLQLKTDGDYNATCDASKPVNAKIVVTGPVGAAGTVKVAVEDFFGRKTHNGEFAFTISEAIANGYGEAAFALPESAWVKGAHNIRCDVTPKDGKVFLPFHDYLRLNRFTYADNTKKLHEMPGTFPGAASTWDDRYLGYLRLHGIGSCAYAPADKGEQEGWEQMRRYGIRNYGVHLFIQGRSGGTEWFTIGPFQADNYSRRRYLYADKSPYKETCAYDEDFLMWAETNSYNFVKSHPWVDVFWSDTEPYHRVRTLREGKFDEYAKLILRMWKGLKRANPKAKFQITGNCSSARGFREPILRLMKECKRQEPAFEVDWADVHIYRAFSEQPSLDADQLAFFKELDEAGFKDVPVNHGEGTYFYPLIVSEWNDIAPWSGCASKDPMWVCGIPSYDLGWGEILGAAQTVRSYLMCYKNAPRIKSSTMWQPLQLDSEVAYAFAPALTALVDLLGDATFKEEIRFAPDCYAYVFDDGHDHLTAAVWKFDELVDRGKKNGDRMNVPAVKGLEVFDMMGNEVKVGGQGQQRMADLPLGMFPMYLRVAKGDSAKLIGTIKNIEVVGKGALPLTFTACIDSRETAAVTAENTLSREVKTTLSIGGGAGVALTFRPGEKKTIAYRLPETLPFDRFTDVDIPVSMSVGTRVESTSFSIRVLPVTYAKGAVDWQKIPSAGLPYYWHNRGEAEYKGSADLSGGIRMAWSEEGLRLRVEARDDVFCVDRETSLARELGPSAWYDNDAIQFYFDSLGDGRDNARRGIFGFDTNDYGYEIIPKPDAKGFDVFRREAPETQLTGGFGEHGLQPKTLEPGVTGDFRREGDRSIYDITFPKRYLMPAEFNEKAHPCFSMMIHDRDEKGDKPHAKGFVTTMSEAEGRSPGQCAHRYVQLLFVK